MEAKNLFYDTNSIVYLFEYKVKNRILNKKINMDFLYELAKKHNGYITSVSINEVLFQCYEGNQKNWNKGKEDFDGYIGFIENTFPNSNWYLKEKNQPLNQLDLKRIDEEKVKKILDKKLSDEADYVFRIFGNFGISLQNSYEDILGRKIHKTIYPQLININVEEFYGKIKDIINTRYHEGNIHNKEVDKALDDFFYNYIIRNLSLHAVNFNISLRKINSWSNEEKEEFQNLQRDLPSPNNEKFVEIINKKFSELKINNKPILDEDMVKIIDQLKEEGHIKDIRYKDFKKFITKAKESEIRDVEGEEAFFLEIYDSPDYLYIKPKKEIEGKGAQYVSWVVGRLKKLKGGSEIKKHIYSNLENFFSYYRSEGPADYTKECEKYFSFLIEELLENSRKISKNDANDYLIATAPDYIRMENSVIITFDTTMKKFVELKSKYYDQSICEKLEI